MYGELMHSVAFHVALHYSPNYQYSKTCVKLPLKNRQNKSLNENWYLNAGRKYCRMVCCIF